MKNQNKLAYALLLIASAANATGAYATETWEIDKEGSQNLRIVAAQTRNTIGKWLSEFENTMSPILGYRYNKDGALSLGGEASKCWQNIDIAYRLCADLCNDLNKYQSNYFSSAYIAHNLANLEAWLLRAQEAFQTAIRLFELRRLTYPEGEIRTNPRPNTSEDASLALALALDEELNG